jgi:hypothetical protein
VSSRASPDLDIYRARFLLIAAMDAQWVRRLMVPANAAAMVSGDQVVAKSTFWKPVY